MNWDNISLLLENQDKFQRLMSDSFQNQFEAGRRIQEQAGHVESPIRYSSFLSKIDNEQDFRYGHEASKEFLADWEAYEEVTENSGALRGLIRTRESLMNSEGIWDAKLAQLLETAEKLKERFAPFGRILREWEEDYFPPLRKITADFMENIFELEKSSKLLSGPLAWESFDSESLKRFADELDEIGLTVNQDGSIIIDNQIVSAHEIKEEVGNILNRVGTENKQMPIPNLIGNLVKKASKSKNSRVKVIIGRVILFILSTLILNLISHFINPVIEKEVKKLMVKKPKRITKTVTRHSTFGSIFFYNSRLVIANQLNVRQKPGRKSKLMGKLELGDVVTIKRIKKDWALIYYEDQDNSVLIQGWVFQRYLKKFKNRVKLVTNDG